MEMKRSAGNDLRAMLEAKSPAFVKCQMWGREERKRTVAVLLHGGAIKGMRSKMLGSILNVLGVRS